MEALSTQHVRFDQQVERSQHHGAGADLIGERAAAMYSLIGTAKLNDVDPQAWLADVLRRIADHPASRLDELLPWYWKKTAVHAAAA